MRHIPDIVQECSAFTGLSVYRIFLYAFGELTEEEAHERVKWYTKTGTINKRLRKKCRQLMSEKIEADKCRVEEEKERFARLTKSPR